MKDKLRAADIGCKHCTNRSSEGLFISRCSPCDMKVQEMSCEEGYALAISEFKKEIDRMDIDSENMKDNEFKAGMGKVLYELKIYLRSKSK